MPLNITAKIVDGKTAWGAEPLTLEQTSSGWTARQDWTVSGTRDVIEAEIGSVGQVPKIGDPLTAGIPGLQVVNRTWKTIGGVFDTAAQAGGHVWLAVSYATPNAGGRLPDPVDGLKYSRFLPSTTTLNRVYDARKELGAGYSVIAPPGETTVWSGPVKGGRGYNVAVGQQEIEVTVYRKADAITSAMVARLIELQNFQAVNKADQGVPAIYGTSVQFTFTPGQLRYVGYNLEADRGLVKLTHTLAAAPDWWARWVREDEFGEAVGDPITTVAYAAMDFAGLW